MARKAALSVITGRLSLDQDKLRHRRQLPFTPASPAPADVTVDSPAIDNMDLDLGPSAIAGRPQSALTRSQSSVR